MKEDIMKQLDSYCLTVPVAVAKSLCMQMFYIGLNEGRQENNKQQNTII